MQERADQPATYTKVFQGGYQCGEPSRRKCVANAGPVPHISYTVGVLLLPPPRRHRWRSIPWPPRPTRRVGSKASRSFSEVNLPSLPPCYCRSK